MTAPLLVLNAGTIRYVAAGLARLGALTGGGEVAALVGLARMLAFARRQQVHLPQLRRLGQDLGCA
jgi:hypothetical protein